MARVARGPYKPFAFPAGAVFGSLTCIEWRQRTSPGGHRQYAPWMRCVCGHEGFSSKAGLVSGKTKRCEDCKNKAASPPIKYGPKKPFPFNIGDKFGDLTCTGWAPKNKGYHPRMLCRCGWEGLMQRSNVLKGASTRCNSCAKRKAVETRWEKYGYYRICPDAAQRDRLLDRISAIIMRCTNPRSPTYPDYGGRGITVHPAWVENRVEFLRYLVGLDGWDQPELQLDRIDNNGGYVPGNLRFVTRSENMANKRRITAREVEALKQRVAVLEAENADLRHRASGPEESLHDPHG